MTDLEKKAMADLCKKDFNTLSKMRLYAQKYYWSSNDAKKEISNEMLKDMDEIYNRYADRINERFFELTGKVLF